MAERLCRECDVWWWSVRGSVLPISITLLCFQANVYYINATFSLLLRLTLFLAVLGYTKCHCTLYHNLRFNFVVLAFSSYVFGAPQIVHRWWQYHSFSFPLGISRILLFLLMSAYSSNRRHRFSIRMFMTALNSTKFSLHFSQSFAMYF